MRLHPLPPATATAVGHTHSPHLLGGGAAALSHAPLEQMGLDVRWAAGAGMVLARFGGVSARAQAETAERLLREAGLEAELVERRRAALAGPARRRSAPLQGLVARVSALQTDLADVAAVAERHGAALVGRAGHGLSWLRLDEGDARGAAGRPVALPDGGARPPGRHGVAAGRARDPGASLLARRVKERFDPEGTLV